MSRILRMIPVKDQTTARDKDPARYWLCQFLLNGPILTFANAFYKSLNHKQLLNIFDESDRIVE
jgi:hypothetical protein